MYVCLCCDDFQHKRYGQHEPQETFHCCSTGATWQVILLLPSPYDSLPVLLKVLVQQA
jgi:hypothetical protein